MVCCQTSQLKKFLVNLHEIFRINVSRYEEDLWNISLQTTSMRKVIELAYICASICTRHIRFNDAYICVIPHSVHLNV